MNAAKPKFFIMTVTIVFLSVFSGDCFAKKFDDKGFTFFEWHNPAPRIADLGFDLKELCKIIGKGQLLISHNGKKFDLWTNVKGKGEIKPYENARFVTSLSIFNKSREELIDYYMDFEMYPKVMDQFTEGGIIKSEGNSHLVRLKQVYKVTILKLVADFRYLYTQEKNGDLSVLLLDGDVGAGVNRTEFISLGKNKTLVAATQWLDLDNARFVYRTIIKAQPDVKPTAPIGASAMLAEQFRMYIEEGKNYVPDNTENLPRCPVTPVYSKGSIPAETLYRLSELGTLVFVHPKQWIQTEKGPKSVEFVSSAAQIPGNIKQSKPISADFTRFNEYFDQARKVEYRDVAGGTEIEWHFKFGFGIVGVGMNYTINSIWQNENTVFFNGIKGDIDPLHGAWEWIELDNDNTIVVFTAAMQIGDDASWLLKLGNKVPNINIIGPIFMGTLIVEKQGKWLEPQLKKNEHDIAASL